MSPGNLPYTVYALGDSAITIDFGNTIDVAVNQKVVHLFHQLQETPLFGIIDIVPAYSSLTVHYDILQIRGKNAESPTAFITIKQWVEEQLQHPVQQVVTEQRLIRVPVCYETEYAPDLQNLIATKNLSIEAFISHHTSKIYKVFMIGFLPGFAYMGQVDDTIAMPRKQQPNIVAAGSVGIAGKQTGIYPLISPGGWHIVGRTPMKIFDSERKDPILLRTGDTIQFYSISKAEYAGH